MNDRVIVIIGHCDHGTTGLIEIIENRINRDIVLVEDLKEEVQSLKITPRPNFDEIIQLNTHFSGKSARNERREKGRRIAKMNKRR